MVRPITTTVTKVHAAGSPGLGPRGARMIRGKLPAALLLGLAYAGPLAAQRPVETADLLRLRTVSDPQLSPDGAWVAYTVSAADTVRDERDRDLAFLHRGGEVSHGCEEVRHRGGKAGGEEVTGINGKAVRPHKGFRDAGAGGHNPPALFFTTF